MKTRRDFIKSTGFIGLVCGCSGVINLVSGCLPIKYAQFTETKEKMTIKKTELSSKDFVLIKSQNLDAPLYVSYDADGRYGAMLMLCTHKGCELKPAGKAVVCPCHGSEFDRAGKVTKSPAAKNLVTYKVTADDDNIYVHLN